MARVKRGQVHKQKRERLLKYTKGFRWGRKSKLRLAKEALIHAWMHSYKHRKNKKGDFRKLWQTQINAASRQQGITYSRLINALKIKSITLDRKVLSEIVQKHPKIFEKIIEQVK
ncbi:MAG: 50S ribosomal protein L20 [Patescibacteria group bacterium]|nr:50S ribosomal protein L20 [Patescibacteria group bacterium]MBU1877292.1 50S ribosomal protein L20 [Patescibacteria group bacterium]